MKPKRLFINDSFCIHLACRWTANALSKNHRHWACSHAAFISSSIAWVFWSTTEIAFFYIHNNKKEKRDAELGTLWVVIYCNVSYIEPGMRKLRLI